MVVTISVSVINHNGCDERECASNECTAMENHRNEVMRYAEIGFFNVVFYSAFLPNGEAQKQRDKLVPSHLVFYSSTHSTSMTFEVKLFNVHLMNTGNCKPILFAQRV